MSGLAEEFPGQVVGSNVDAMLPESVADVGELGFANHGLVVRNSSGEVLFKQPDHEVDMDQVRAELQKILGN